MTKRETEEKRKREEAQGLQEFLASDKHKVFLKEALEANAKLCETGVSNAEYPPDPEAQKWFAKRFRAKMLGVVDKYNTDEFPGVEFTEES